MVLQLSDYTCTQQVDTQESSRQQKKAEIRENLKRLYPGVVMLYFSNCVHTYIAFTKCSMRLPDMYVYGLSTYVCVYESMYVCSMQYGRLIDLCEPVHRR